MVGTSLGVVASRPRRYRLLDAGIPQNFRAAQEGGYDETRQNPSIDSER
jgi:hypothetical protein